MPLLALIAAAFETPSTRYVVELVEIPAPRLMALRFARVVSIDVPGSSSDSLRATRSPVGSVLRTEC